MLREALCFLENLIRNGYGRLHTKSITSGMTAIQPISWPLLVLGRLAVGAAEHHEIAVRVS